MKLTKLTRRLLSLLLLSLACLSLFSACDEKASESETEDTVIEEESIADEMIGTWYDPLRPRVSLTVEKRLSGNYDVTISWSDSAYQVYEWRFIGHEKGEKIITSKCQKVLLTYTSEEDFEEEVIFKNGKAALYFDKDGKLCWQDETENVGEDCRFEKNKALAS